MNCQVARQTLDAARPGRQDWDEPELRDAAGHVSECDDCQAVVEQSDRFDRRVSVAMQNIEVPTDLKARLLASLEQDATDSVVTPTTELRPVTNRRIWSITSSAALLLVVCVGWWMYSHRAVPISMDDVYASLNTQLVSPESLVEIDSLPKFDEQFDGEVHDLLWETQLTSAAHGLDLDGLEGHDAAVYRFDIGKTGRMSGWLVVIDKDQVANPPSSSAPNRGSVRYNPQPHFAWTSGDQVYVCILDNGRPDRVIEEMFGGVA